MVKHVILWTLKDEYSSKDKEEIKAGIKEGLEGLAGKIPGLVEFCTFSFLLNIYLGTELLGHMATLSHPCRSCQTFSNGVH